MGEKNRNYLAAETGCDIQVKIPNGSRRSPLLDPIVVTLTGSYEGELDFAQRWVENRIVSTEPEDQRGRMLYYLAKYNDYGASEGLARYQRSPSDLKSWVWMVVVELPSGFEKCAGLFIDKHGKAIKEIIRNTRCRCISLSESFPKHFFLCEANLDIVNAAFDAVNDRVLWALEEYQKRNKQSCWKYDI